MKGRRHDGSAERWGAAVAVSVAVHAGALALVADLRGTRAVPRQNAIVVAVVEGAGGAPAAGPEPGTVAGRSGEQLDRVASAVPPSNAIAAANAAALPVPRQHAERRSAPALRAPRHAATVPADVAARDALAIRDHAEAESVAGADPPAPERAAPDAGVGAAADDASTGGARGTGGGGGAGGGDLRAWCRSCPRPEYPARARREGWQGTVDVELHVDRDGIVEHASVERSSGFAVLDAAAVTVARQSRFTVPRGESLRGQLRYRFVLEEGLSRRPL